MVRLAVWACLAIAACLPVRAQENDNLEAGKLLVADDRLRDPNFVQSVILLVRHNDDGTVGLMINRRSKVPLSDVIPSPAGSKDQSAVVYEGGPVEQSGVLGLLRSKNDVDNAGRVFADVYVTTSKDVLVKAVREHKDDTSFRAYLGYCGWAPGQLEMEIAAGAWHVMDAEAKLVFDPHPETLWRRLLDKTDLRMVRAPENLNPAVQLIPADLAGFKTKIEKDAPAVGPMG